MSDDEGYAPAAQMLIFFIFPASVQKNTDSDDRCHRITLTSRSEVPTTKTELFRRASTAAAHNLALVRSSIATSWSVISKDSSILALPWSLMIAPGQPPRHMTDHRSSSDFYGPDLLRLNARRIQAFLQQQEFLKAFDASERFLRFQEPGSRPTQRLISFSPALYVPRHALHRRQTRFDRVGGCQFSPQHRSDTQAMDGQRLFQPLLEASCRARIDPFQLPEDFLQRRFGLRVVVHRIRIAHPSVVVLLAVLRQILLHIPSFMNLAALHLHLCAENPFHPRAQRFRSVDHHQIPSLQIQSAIYQIFQQPFDHRGVLRGPLPHS